MFNINFAFTFTFLVNFNFNAIVNNLYIYTKRNLIIGIDIELKDANVFNNMYDY